MIRLASWKAKVFGQAVGGSNGARIRAWKVELQRKLGDRFGLAVTVCHYPPGASKWNPCDHRLFAAISNNWQGHPLESLSNCEVSSIASSASGRMRMTRREAPGCSQRSQ